MAEKISVAGAGLVGSLLAIYLRKRGYDVDVFESRTDMRRDTISAGRSINLALSDRGIKALEEVGIMNDIREIAIPMHGRYLHNADGSNAFQPYGQKGQFINSVSRGELNKKLMSLAESAGAKIHFNKKIESINWKTNEMIFSDNTSHSCDVIFGADGAYSATRLQHMLHHNKFQYNQYYIDYGYKELSIPAGPGNSFLIEKNALHIWPRGNYMMIALPNIDGSFTCTLFFPFEGNPSFDSLNTNESVIAFFKEHFSDAFELMPTLTEDFNTNPISSLVTVKCYPWIRENKFALIGDAAHAMVPFFGQGMNCGFEDCSVLNELIETFNGDWKEILPAYQHLRKPDGDAICDMALTNFIEMRDRVADPKFLLQKKIEAEFTKRHPDKWRPAYSLVTFSPEVRYSDALKQGTHQEEIMKKIMSVENIEDIWDSHEVENKILQNLVS
ncbi:MAG: FAD-dependent monooxygenase [Bacteroidetes bacterium]|nr:FAD-dependent monooxygenase [Bacteroidota bacterium]